MASKQSTVNYLLEQMAGAADVGIITARKMFGEYSVYCAGKLVALVADDRLFVKPTVAGRAFLGQGNAVEASPYPGAKPCFLISEAQCGDAVWLSHLIKVSAAELPLPTKRVKD